MSALPSSPTTASALQWTIRQDLINGVYPAGAKLRIRELAERYGVGTIPLREALSRLCSTGFVVAVDQKGFRVSEISESELRDITHARRQLESLALREGIARRDAGWEGRVLAASHQLKHIPLYQDGVLNPDWERAHETFHEILTSGGDSEWIARFCATLREQTARYRALSAGIGHAEHRDVDAEHGAIVQAILDHDADRACELLCEHFSATTRLVGELLKRRAAA
ncbi:HTH-type transcriptional repressor CsiR [Pigmentiphaga humi]|uniref:HTH-type transcriptional repressor CsiR n=1 Tax=Pigmentiphaga humi TaxID=2478468 RepID=A0A3P4B6I8_9BURK|nr:GntR family transcriptional regulator [Pigmentiphaga humi]VCU70795.1 HTH-type transcriptional repressor CsiR [Pigmentiphaga humi]